MSLELDKGFRADIKTLLEDVPEIGRVWGEELDINLWKIFVDAFGTKITGKNVIRGWMIILNPDVERIQITFGNPGCIQETYSYKIMGFFGLRKIDRVVQTEKTIAQFVTDKVVPIFNASISSRTDVTQWNMPAMLTSISSQTFGSALCHIAEISLNVMVIN